MNDKYRQFSEELVRGASGMYDPRTTERDVAALAAANVIGIVLLRPETLSKLKIQPGDISDAQTRRVLDVMLALRAEGRVIEPLTIAKAVCSPKEPVAEVLAWLLGMQADVISTEMLTHYEQMVLDFAGAEKLRIAATKVASAQQTDETHTGLRAAVANFLRLARDLGYAKDDVKDDAKDGAKDDA